MPRAAHHVLTWVLLGSAAVTLVFVAFPGGYERQRALELQVVGGLLVLSAFTWFVVPRLPEPWGLDLCVLLPGVLAAWTTAVLPEDEGQMLIGCGLMMLTIFGAFYRSPRHAMALTGALLAMWIVAISVDPRISPAVVAAGLCLIVLGVTFLVSVLVSRLNHLALHDGLTGLLNRRGLELLAEPVVAAARRAELPLTVGIVDVDHFKSFNDTRGHLAGDRLLFALADAWRRTARESDLVARFGGDEIVLLLVGATEVEARALDARALSTFQELRPDDWSSGWTLGITALGPDELLHQAIDRADAEMLERKRSGRTVPPQREPMDGQAPAVDVSTDPAESATGPLEPQP
jgi:diguanylate cyclase (GGDEF)-like protein